MQYNSIQQHAEHSQSDCLSVLCTAVTVYAGTEVATLEQVEVPVESVQTISSDGGRMTIDEQKLELLSNLAEEAGTNLCPEEMGREHV